MQHPEHPPALTVCCVKRTRLHGMDNSGFGFLQQHLVVKILHVHASKRTHTHECTYTCTHSKKNVYAWTHTHTVHSKKAARHCTNSMVHPLPRRPWGSSRHAHFYSWWSSFVCVGIWDPSIINAQSWNYLHYLLTSQSSRLENEWRRNESAGIIRCSVAFSCLYQNGKIKQLPATEALLLLQPIVPLLKTDVR